MWGEAAYKVFCVWGWCFGCPRDVTVGFRYDDVDRGGHAKVPREST